MKIIILDIKYILTWFRIDCSMSASSEEDFETEIQNTIFTSISEQTGLSIRHFSVY